MNDELELRLRRQRQIVDDGGLHFESWPMQVPTNGDDSPKCVRNILQDTESLTRCSSILPQDFLSRCRSVQGLDGLDDNENAFQAFCVEEMQTFSSHLVEVRGITEGLRKELDAERELRCAFERSQDATTEKVEACLQELRLDIEHQLEQEQIIRGSTGERLTNFEAIVAHLLESTEGLGRAMDPLRVCQLDIVQLNLDMNSMASAGSLLASQDDIAQLQQDMANFLEDLGEVRSFVESGTTDTPHVGDAVDDIRQRTEKLELAVAGTKRDMVALLAQEQISSRATARFQQQTASVENALRELSHVTSEKVTCVQMESAFSTWSSRLEQRLAEEGLPGVDDAASSQQLNQSNGAIASEQLSQQVMQVHHEVVDLARHMEQSHSRIVQDITGLQSTVQKQEHTTQNLEWCRENIVSLQRSVQERSLLTSKGKENMNGVSGISNPATKPQLRAPIQFRA